MSDKDIFRTKEEARVYVGGLSDTTKMPGKSASISAFDCKVGSKLAEVPGSVCHGCYARKGNYTRFPAVRRALKARTKKLKRLLWVPAMARAIGKDPWFRWHDSGDLQDQSHLENIVEVCVRTPHTNHWLPTREVGIVRKFLRTGGEFPPNLCVRVSAAMIDGVPPRGFENTSTVHRVNGTLGDECPAHLQDDRCGSCRACWDTGVKNISYRKH